MIVWVTKYALTKGILKKDAEDCGGDMLRVRTGALPEYYHKGEWYENESDAKVKAEEMRIKKIAGLKKQLERYENMKF